MSTRILGGIAGWVLGVAPLLAVNVMDYFGVYSFPDAFLAGAIALVAGVLLGGVTAGLIGGRSPRAGGGAVGAGTTGIVAATLYAVSVIGFMEVARTFDALPLALVEHPIRSALGIVFLAALLLLVAYVAGTLAGRPVPSPAANVPQPGQTARAASIPDERQVAGSGRYGGQPYGARPYSQPRGRDVAAQSRPNRVRSDSREWQSADASDPRYAGTRVYGPPSGPAHGTDSTPRWR